MSSKLLLKVHQFLKMFYIIAIEIIHNMNCQTREKISEFALKIEPHKAFDKVD